MTKPVPFGALLDSLNDLIKVDAAFRAARTPTGAEWGEAKTLTLALESANKEAMERDLWETARPLLVRLRESAPQFLALLDKGAIPGETLRQTLTDDVHAFKLFSSKLT